MREGEERQREGERERVREDVHGPAATAVIYLTAVAVSAQGASALATQYDDFSIVVGSRLQRLENPFPDAMGQGVDGG